jgi:hypothetical protein
MADTRHTPGPWHEEARYGARLREYIVGHERAVDGSTSTVIVAVVPFAANRPLVTAAPDLLEALEVIYHDTSISPRVQEIARAAIEKATKETP